MGQLIIAANYGIAVTSDEVTATRNDVIKGKTALTSDSDDEIIDGTLELTGTAGDYDVLDGKTFYTKDPKVKKTGRMTNNGTDVEAYACGVNGNRLYYDIPQGFYTNPGDDPKVYAMEYNVAHEIGLTEDMLLVGNTILGVEGSYTPPVPPVPPTIKQTTMELFQTKNIAANGEAMISVDTSLAFYDVAIVTLGFIGGALEAGGIISLTKAQHIENELSIPVKGGGRFYIKLDGAWINIRSTSSSVQTVILCGAGGVFNANDKTCLVQYVDDISMG